MSPRICNKSTANLFGSFAGPSICLSFFRHIHCKGRNSFTQSKHSVILICQLILSDEIVSDVRCFWLWKFYSPIYSKFAIKRDWKSKISQNIRNLKHTKFKTYGIQNIRNFLKKPKNRFFKIGKCGKFAVECLLNDCLIKMPFSHLNQVFFGELRKILYLEEKIVFFRESAFHLSKRCL